MILFFIVNHVLRDFEVNLCLNGVCCFWQSILGFFLYDSIFLFLFILLFNEFVAFLHREEKPV